MEDDLWCEYSDLPSPMAYAKNKTTMKKSKIKKIWFALTVFLSKFKRKRKSIWDL